MFSRANNMRHVKLYSDSIYDKPEYDRPVSQISLPGTSTTTWKCPDCGRSHTTAENRKYYCTILSRF